jgi:hypothetical protein
MQTKDQKQTPKPKTTKRVIYDVWGKPRIAEFVRGIHI